MTNRVQLNNVDHHDFRVIAGHRAAWGDAVNQAVIFPTEFEEAARDYPILFRRDSEGDWVSVALLGLDADENLFLDGDQWLARHVPALHQRGPFTIGVPLGDDDEGEPTLHIDLDDPRVGRATGQALFREHGGNTPYLDRMAAILNAIHVGHHVRLPLAGALEEAGLIQPATIRLEVEAGLVYDLPDFFIVPREALDLLDGATLARLNADGFLRAAFAASSSLGNIGRIVELKRQRLGDGR